MFFVKLALAARRTPRARVEHRRGGRSMGRKYYFEFKEISEMKILKAKMCTKIKILIK